MVKGIKITQHVFKNDGIDVTIGDAADLFGAFLDVCCARGLHTGGEVRLVDDEGVVLKGGFRNAGAGIMRVLQSPKRADDNAGLDISEMSGDEARTSLRRIQDAAEAFLAVMHKEQGDG